MKGEIVLIIEREAPNAEPRELSALAARVREIESGGADQKSALKQAAREFGVGKSEAYRIVQADKDAT